MGRRICFMAYVSITGLKLKSIIHAPEFWWHAISSMAQAKRAAGNLSTDARTINGVHHTVTLWENREAMLAYLRSGAHLKAMKSFKRVGTGKVLGYEADQAPAWGEVHDLWQTKGRNV